MHTAIKNTNANTIVLNLHDPLSLLPVDVLVLVVVNDYDDSKFLVDCCVIGLIFLLKFVALRYSCCCCRVFSYNIIFFFFFTVVVVNIIIIVVVVVVLVLMLLLLMLLKGSINR